MDYVALLDRRARLDVCAVSDALDSLGIDGAAVVEPGDCLRGDGDGVIVISKDPEEEILGRVAGIDTAVQEIRAT